MNCFNPVKIILSDEERARRLALPENYPLLYRMATFVYVPCGKCEACLSKRKSDWFVRLKKEFEHSESSYFVTLTYDDANLNYDLKRVDGFLLPLPSVSKKDCQLFLKRFRKSIQPFKIRYFLISEYGPRTLRPHYHMLLFGFPKILERNLYDYLFNAWGNGFISYSPVTDARIGYCVSYCLDSSALPPGFEKNFMLCSRKPGLGSVLLDDGTICDYIVNSEKHSVPVYSDGKTKEFPVPRYYKDKLFDRDLKDKIACDGVIRHSKEVSELVRSQKQWLESKGIEVNSFNLHREFDGSPLSLKRQSEESFKKKVRNKNKMNKKKL